MNGHDMLDELARLVEQRATDEGFQATDVEALSFIRMVRPREQIPGVYEPALCLVVQGAKEVLLDDGVIGYHEGEYLVVSVDMPAVGQVTEGSAQRPYLAVHLKLDLHGQAGLLARGNLPHIPEAAPGRALMVGHADAPLLEAVLRLVRLLDAPRDIPALAPLMLGEVYYRLLTGPEGAAIAQLAVRGSPLQRIARVIRAMQEDFTQPLSVDRLAHMAHLSTSAFHKHFKRITGMSPLQYQKRMRLVEARRLLLTQEVLASSVARKVGYESVSQFSREYARQFGVPPSVDGGHRKAGQQRRSV